MTTNKVNIEQLISRKLAGELTPFETQQLFDWIAESEENTLLYHQMISIFSRQQKQIRKTKVWDMTKDKSNLVRSASRISLITRRLLKVVAVLVLIALIPLVFGKLGDYGENNGFIHTVTGNDVVTSFYLPDSSKVFLSRGSEISYNDEFNQKNRELFLKGKAYIEINEQTSNLPVIVNSGKRCAIASDAKLLVNSENNQFDVAVETGEAIIVDTISKKVVIPMFKLTPAKKKGDKAFAKKTKVSGGQQASYSSTDVIAKTAINNYCEVFSWKDKVFCFDKLKQHELASAISKWYGKIVEFKGEMDPYKNYSGSYDNPTAKHLINAIFNNQVKSIKETKRKITVVFS